MFLKWKWHKMYKGKLILLFLCCFCMIVVTAQAQVKSKQLSPSEEQMLKSLREKMRKDHEMINRLLNDDLFSSINPDFHQRFRKLLENFYQDSDDDLLNQQRFDQFFKQWVPGNYLEEGDGAWTETASERVLVLKLDLPKDSPLDIKIEKEIIHVSGKTIRRRVSPQGESLEEEMQFQKVFPVPSDCDGTSAKFENDEGKIKIRLPKRSPKIKQIIPKKGDLTL